MREDDISDVLESIGLNKNEVIVYLDLIRVGKSSVIDIAKRTKIHRSNTYDILEKLLKKGIVDQSIDNEKKFFYPIDPKDFLDYHKQKEIELLRIIPEIEKIQNKPREEMRVTTSEGLNSVKSIILHLLDDKEIIYKYGTSHHILNTLGEGFVNEFHRIRIKKEIPLKRIFNIKSINRARELSTMPYTEVRYIPSFKSNISTSITGNRVVIIIFEMPVTAIVIESKSVADAYRNDFNLIWEEALSLEGRQENV